MKLKAVLWPILFYLFLTLIFFHKIFLGFVPFPGDLLVSRYQPWRSFSYLGYLPGSYPTKDQYFDVLRQIYPWKTESLKQIKSGQVPLWNPYNFSGSPLLANNQSAVFYPLNFFYFLASQINAWTILIMLQSLLAGIFTYFFARQIGLGKNGSFFSGIAFGYSLFLTVFTEYNTINQTILWLPLILLAVHKLIGKSSRAWTLVFIFASLFSLLAGHLQVFAGVYGLAIIYLFYCLFFKKDFRKKNLFKWLALIFLPIGLGAIQLLPTFELIQNAARVSQNYQFLIHQLLIQPKDLLRFFAPDLFGNPAVGNYLLQDPYPGKAVYIGLIPLAFSLLAIIFREKRTKFFIIIPLAALIFIIRSPLTEIFYKLQLPLISTSSPSNMIFIISFCLSILAGFGLEKFYKEPRKIIAVVALFAFVFISLWIFRGHMAVIGRNLFYSTVIFIVLCFLLSLRFIFKKEQFFSILTILLLVLTLFDSYYFFKKFNSFVPKELVFPKAQVTEFLKKETGINRYWGYGAANIEANFATQEKLFSTDGYDPLYPKRYGEFIQSSRGGKIETKFDNTTRSDAFITSGFGEVDMRNNLYREKVLNILGVKYILDRIENGSTQETFPPEKYQQVYQDKNGWKIFENLKVAPRLFLTSDYKVFKTKEEFEKLFLDQNFDPAKTIFLEEELSNHLLDLNKQSFSTNQVNQAGNVIVEDYQPNHIKLLTETKGNQLLFLSDTYYPGWKAFIDGKESKIYRADYAFRAVVVPAGSHEVIFSYEPQSFYLGVKISIISLALFIIFLVFAV